MYSDFCQHLKYRSLSQQFIVLQIAPSQTWHKSLVTVIVSISLKTQSRFDVPGERKLLTLKLFLLFFTKKKAKGTYETDIRLFQTNRRFYCQLKVKELVKILVLFVWKIQKKNCKYPFVCDENPHPPLCHLHPPAFLSNYSKPTRPLFFRTSVIFPLNRFKSRL